MALLPTLPKSSTSNDRLRSSDMRIRAPIAKYGRVSVCFEDCEKAPESLNPERSYSLVTRDTPNFTKGEMAPPGRGEYRKEAATAEPLCRDEV